MVPTRSKSREKDQKLNEVPPRSLRAQITNPRQILCAPRQFFTLLSAGANNRIIARSRRDYRGVRRFFPQLAVAKFDLTLLPATRDFITIFREILLDAEEIVHVTERA